jgi:ferredoxin
MKVIIDHDRCSGHGRCFVLSPALFVDDENGYGQVIGDGEVSDDTRAAAERAVRACPEQAIRLDP